MVVFARDDDETIGRLDQARQSFQHLRRLAWLVLLVHPVEQRQPIESGVDRVSPCGRVPGIRRG